MAKLNETVHCETHGDQKAIFVCCHIKSPADVAFTDGEDFHCAIDGPKHTSEEIYVLCKLCAMAEGLILQ